MERCRTCKHYGASPEEDPSGRLGECRRWHKGYHVDVKDVADNEALVEDDEGWGMLLGPDFGCVLHEAK